jgi:hypothetical protein
MLMRFGFQIQKLLSIKTNFPYQITQIADSILNSHLIQLCLARLDFYSIDWEYFGNELQYIW